MVQEPGLSDIGVVICFAAGLVDGEEIPGPPSAGGSPGGKPWPVIIWLGINLPHPVNEIRKRQASKVA